MKNKVKVFDFSIRLPGPLAGYILAKQNYEVYKVESREYPDPFSLLSMQEFEPIFKVWYEKLNSPKTFIRASNEDISKELNKVFGNTNIFLCGNIKKLKEIIGDFPIGTQNIIIEIKASKEGPMHDLNALASEPIFKVHLKDSLTPPFVPFAGLNFAQSIAFEAIDALANLKDQTIVERTVYLKDSTHLLFDPLWDTTIAKNQSFLHTGKFPSYRVYQAKDCKIAVAAVEEKFWNAFIQAFNLNLSEDDRLSSDPEIVKIIEREIIKYNRQDLQEMALSQMCLTLI